MAKDSHRRIGGQNGTDKKVPDGSGDRVGKGR